MNQAQAFERRSATAGPKSSRSVPETRGLARLPVPISILLITVFHFTSPSHPVGE